MALIPPTKTQQDIIDYKIKLNSPKTEDDIKKILSWIRAQDEFPIAKDLKKKEFIETFYFQCKFNCEKTIKTYKNYCKIRNTEFFHNRDPYSLDMKESFETLFMFTLPQLSEEGYRIGFCGLVDPDVAKFSAETMMKRSLMHFDLRLQEEKCLGDIYIMDLKLFSISHLKQFSLSFIRKCIDCQIDAMPFRIKQIHFLNASWFVSSFINVFKFFLKEKLKKRIYVHSDDYTKFHNSVQKNILPSDYDGQGPSIIELNNAWRDKLIEHRDWFKKIDEESRS